VVQTPTERALSGDVRQVWALPEPVGTVELSVATDNLEAASEITFRASGFPTGDDARLAGETFRSWLRFASASAGFGLDCGRDVPLSSLGEGVRRQLQELLAHEKVVLVDDVHGLAFYEDIGRPLRFAARATGRVLLPSRPLLDAVVRAGHGPPLNNERLLVCDLVSSVYRETSDDTRLLTLVTAMEVLAGRHERTGGARALVEEFIETAAQSERSATSDEERKEFNSLLGSLRRDLRYRSISALVQDWARSVRPDDPEAPKLAKRCYNCRSNLVHAGTANENPAQLWPQVLALMLEDIRKWVTEQDC
jgi:hypothetical protein